MPDLDDLTLDDIHLAQQAAVVRLQLFVTGEIHALLEPVVDEAWDALRSEPADEPVSPAAALRARNAVREAWGEFHESYVELLGNAMREAASIVFGTMAVYHREMVLPVVDDEEDLPLTGLAGALPHRAFPFTEQRPVEDGVFTPQLQEILLAAEQRVYDDGLQLSGRIWRLDTQSKAEIDRLVQAALANGDSAWDLAQSVERYLGPNQDCPRWVDDRLFDLTKFDIASGDRTGLVTGDECDGQGVSYNALRLARTEIQAAHHIATDMLMAKMPWVDQEQIHLSPEHAITDICDDVVSGGEDGDGVYEKGEISLPLHPHCMCYKTAVLMDNDEFVKKLRGWMRGQEQWAAMDSYQRMLGGSVDVDLSGGIAASMSSWLWDNKVSLTTVLWRTIGSL